MIVFWKLKKKNSRLNSFIELNFKINLMDKNQPKKHDLI
jgi:hypothetical protein